MTAKASSRGQFFLDLLRAGWHSSAEPLKRAVPEDDEPKPIPLHLDALIREQLRGYFLDEYSWKKTRKMIEDRYDCSINHPRYDDYFLLKVKAYGLGHFP